MFLHTVQGINEILDDAERIGVGSYFENCLGCLTGYLSLLCLETQYDKVAIYYPDSYSVYLFVGDFSLISTILIHSISGFPKLEWQKRIWTTLIQRLR